MSILQILPVLAYSGCILAVMAIAANRGMSVPLRWVLPAGLGVLFLVFSLFVLVQDGLLMFWTNHISNWAGNQVWIDLLLAVSISFYLMAPRARAVGMALGPWAVAVAMTACVALLPMLARLIWLEHKAGNQA